MEFPTHQICASKVNSGPWRSGEDVPVENETVKVVRHNQDIMQGIDDVASFNSSQFLWMVDVLDERYLAITLLITLAWQILFYIPAGIFKFDKVTDLV